MFKISWKDKVTNENVLRFYGFTENETAEFALHKKRSKAETGTRWTRLRGLVILMFCCCSEGNLKESKQKEGLKGLGLITAAMDAEKQVVKLKDWLSTLRHG